MSRERQKFTAHICLFLAHRFTSLVYSNLWLSSHPFRLGSRLHPDFCKDVYHLHSQLHSDKYRGPLTHPGLENEAGGGLRLLGCEIGVGEKLEVVPASVGQVGYQGALGPILCWFLSNLSHRFLPNYPKRNSWALILTS